MPSGALLSRDPHSPAKSRSVRLGRTATKEADKRYGRVFLIAMHFKRPAHPLPVAPAHIGSSALMTEVERTWSRIERWLKAHAPEALAVLESGAAQATIDEAEDVLGLELPVAFRRSAARHDGQAWRWPSLLDFGVLMPLAEVVGQWRALQPYTERTQQEAWWRRGWVPFVSRDGDYLSLALDPSNEGPLGSVWCFLHDNDPQHSLMAPDFETWLERWADELEAGVFALDHAPGAGLLLKPGKHEQTQLWPY